MRSLDIKQRATTVALFLALVGAVGALVIVLGGAPIRASSGHWPITRWFLKFSKDRAVATQSWGIGAPPLDDPDRVVRGAGHYETACANCHGSPLRAPSPVNQSATPAPPDLAKLVPQREPRELFYVVRHGILFTGMPAWPAEGRNDEVWDTVAFLLRLPSMDGEEYRTLVFPDLSLNDPVESRATTPAKAALCDRCHGRQGRGRESGDFPRLAGQRHRYLLASLDAYATGARQSGFMQVVAAVLTSEEADELAAYYAALNNVAQSGGEVASDASSSEPRAFNSGREIAENGIPQLGAPSCLDCHGPPDASRASHYPILAGQPVEYLQQQLRLFHDGVRGGASAEVMAPVAENLPEEAFGDVSRYYSHQ